MNAITTYVPKRDYLGRFKPSKKRVVKIIFSALVIGNLFTSWYLFRGLYNFRCESPINNETIGGLLIKKETCNQLVQAQFDSIELSREKNISLNQ